MSPVLRKDIQCRAATTRHQLNQNNVTGTTRGTSLDARLFQQERDAKNLTAAKGTSHTQLGLSPW